MSKKPTDNSIAKPSSALLTASFNAGFADGRIEAIEESMDAVAGLIFKAEAILARLGENPEPAIKESASHTLRALNLAFAAVTGSTNGSAACNSLLDQSRQRLHKKTTAMH